MQAQAFNRDIWDHRNKFSLHSKFKPALVKSPSDMDSEKVKHESPPSQMGSGKIKHESSSSDSKFRRFRSEERSPPTQPWSKQEEDEWIPPTGPGKKRKRNRNRNRQNTNKRPRFESKEEENIEERNTEKDWKGGRYFGGGRGRYEGRQGPFSTVDRDMDDLRKRLKQELKGELKHELRREIKDDLRREFKEQLLAELKEELKSELRVVNRDHGSRASGNTGNYSENRQQQRNSNNAPAGAYNLALQIFHQLQRQQQIQNPQYQQLPQPIQPQNNFPRNHSYSLNHGSRNGYLQPAQPQTRHPNPYQPRSPYDRH